MKYLLIVPAFLFMYTGVSAQEMSRSKKQPVVSTETKTENTVTPETTQTSMGSGKNATPQKVEQPAKKEETVPENNPPATSARKPK